MKTDRIRVAGEATEKRAAFNIQSPPGLIAPAAAANPRKADGFGAP